MSRPRPRPTEPRRKLPPGIGEDDLAFETAFARGETPGGAFGHEDHVRLAWICLRRAPLAEAAGRFIRMLKAFAASRGADRLYHDTITWAFLLLIQDRLTLLPEDHDWREFGERNRDLLTYSPSILSRYYRRETLQSERARAGFVMPDAWLEAPPAPLSPPRGRGRRRGGAPGPGRCPPA